MHDHSSNLVKISEVDEIEYKLKEAVDKELLEKNINYETYKK